MPYAIYSIHDQDVTFTGTVFDIIAFVSFIVINHQETFIPKYYFIGLSNN